jgi:hypothetical protein
MKARYKIGMLVKINETSDTPEVWGMIEAIIIRTDGVHYQLSDDKGEITEKEISSVFKEWKARTPKEGTTKRARKSRTRDAQAA